MIERYVFVKLVDAWAGAARRAEVAAESRRALGALDGVVDVRVGTPADEHASAAWDLSIAVTFDRLEDVGPYLSDPAHRAYVDDYLRPKLEVIKAWNFHLG